MVAFKKKLLVLGLGLVIENSRTRARRRTRTSQRFNGLDFAAHRAKNCGMNSRAENFYAVWRERCRAGSALHDGGSVPPEKLLQAIWQHQRLQRDQLKTADGRLVRVFHPGFVSVEGGPDFRGAVLKIGDEPAVSGDVEVDLQASGWHAHGHDRNPNFKSVILHVVWDEVKQNPSGQGIYSGLGHWTNGNAELCLFAKRGKPKRQAKNIKQIVLSPRGRHSAKPLEVRDRIVSLIGDVPRIELFARQTAKGWDSWGNEIEKG